MSEALCIHCGRGADAHHEFQAVSLPDGCQCNPLTWAPESPRPVCNGYEGTGETYCGRCEHDRECHEEAPPCAP